METRVQPLVRNQPMKRHAQNVSAFLFSCTATISTLVSINSLTPFLLEYARDANESNKGAVAGSLVLADELLCMPLVLIWGYVVDKGKKDGS
jgi:hypothetical protein